MYTKYIPLDSYSNKVFDDIIFVTYILYFIDQNNGQSKFLNYVCVC
jgi:hypothetical protein